MPDLFVIAGPNGAGKTTAAQKILPEFLAVNEYVNADKIAEGLSPFHPQSQNILAGRLMLQRIQELIKQKKSFAFESTLASRVFSRILKQAKIAGFTIRLIYLYLPNPELAAARVAKRVEIGGHNIPRQDIFRRFHRSLANLRDLYIPLSHYYYIVDASGIDLVPLYMGMNTVEDVTGHHRWDIWEKNKGAL